MILKKIVSWKSKVLSTEKLTIPTTTDNSLSPSIKWYGDSNFSLIFKGSCLKQRNATFPATNRINIFVFYEFCTWPRDLNSDFTLTIIWVGWGGVGGNFAPLLVSLNN